MSISSFCVRDVQHAQVYSEDREEIISSMSGDVLRDEGRRSQGAQPLEEKSPKGLQRWT